MLTVGDTINGHEVTKVTDKSCWLGNKRFSWETVKKLLSEEQTDVVTKYNQDIPVNWSDKDAVLKYYASFKEWCFYVSSGDTGKHNRHLLEVKDGLIFFEGEYWLPAPTSSVQKPNGKSIVEDGHYNVFLIKKHNNWYGSKSSNLTSNIFYADGKVNANPTLDDIRNLKPNSTEIYCYPSNYGVDFVVDYSHSGRHGLSINSIHVNNFEKFFIKTYCSDRFGYESPRVLIPEEIMHRILYECELSQKLDAVLTDARLKEEYHIEDEEEYGEYSLRYIVMNKNVCERFFATIEATLKSL